MRPSPAPEQPSPSKPADTQWSRYFPWTNTDKLPGLCKSCSKIDFDQFASSPTTPQSGSPKTTTTLISLFDIIKNQRDVKCEFCSLIFDAIALPQHDPFEHPAIKNHMPADLKGKTFETWAKGLRWHNKILKSPQPFGETSNKIQIEQSELDPDEIKEIRRGDLEAAEKAGLIVNASATGAAIQAASQDTNRDRQTIFVTGAHVLSLSTSAFAVMSRKLPAVVTIKMHNIADADAGLLKITVLGYGNKVQASLSSLSQFNLRVGSSCQKDGLSLRYGSIINEHVNVEGDCRKWLEHCLRHHNHLCAKPDWSQMLPPPMGDYFRLIDVRERRVIQVNRNGPRPRYAALSYVWGQAGETALNLHSRDASHPSFNIDGHAKTVARTISDAIELTKRLRLQYLWADSLCVVQKARDGDDEPEIRQSQLDQMGSIFGHASVVIVAASGEDAEAGLAGITQSRKPGQIARGVRPNVNVLFPVEYDKSCGKWDTRAWTLQEKLLSKRMLVFDSNHVSFHCRHGVLREDMPAEHAGNGPPPMARLSKPPNSGEPRVTESWDGKPVLLRSPFFEAYAKLLEQYTSRDRSKSNDILNAILGLLKVLEDMRSVGNTNPSPSGVQVQPPVRTLYGLPEEFLDLALLWQPPAVMGTSLTKRLSDQLPSWSWTGWEVGKDPSHSQDIENKYKARPGVRFEEPFWVSGNDDLALKKFVAIGEDAEERFRPLIIWYKFLNAPNSPNSPSSALVPVNGSGLGIVSGSKDVDERFIRKIVQFRTGLNALEDPGALSLPSGVPLDNRHLVCETQTASFRLRQKDKSPRKESLWNRFGGRLEEKVLDIVEAEVLDEADKVVGYVIPTDQRKTISSDTYDFILLSESQYWGNEKRIDIIGFPLYNVMVVEWDNRKEFATRLGLGKISKLGWLAAQQGKRLVILK